MTRHDAGAQPERTRLAWRRTVLAATIMVLLAARGIVVAGAGGFEVVVLAVLALVWLVILAGSHFRVRALAAARPPALQQRKAVFTVVAVIVLAALSVMALW